MRKERKWFYNMLKKILRSIFIIILIGSVSYLAYDSFREKETMDVFKDSISVIKVQKEEKENIKLEEKKTIKLSPDVDLAQKRIEYNNNDIVGRLEVPGLFNVLIVRGKDNKFYLNKDAKKKYDRKGTEFLDYQVDVRGNQLNIYGHNTRDENVKVPFKVLSKYTKKDYFNDNPYLVFQSDFGREYYKIMAIKQVRHDPEHLRVNLSGEAFVSHIDKLLSNTLNKREMPYDEKSKLLLLQTCAYFAPEPAFYIIIAQKI